VNSPYFYAYLFQKRVDNVNSRVYIVHSVYIQYLRMRDVMNIVIATQSKEPLFKQIKEQIKQHIYSGVLTEGDALPSIRVLAKDLKVSVITTKRAYEDLEKEGYVLSSVGKGTFIAGQQPHVLKEWQVREIENELEKTVQAGKRIGLTKSEMIELLEIYYEEDE